MALEPSKLGIVWSQSKQMMSNFHRIEVDEHLNYMTRGLIG